MKTSELIGKQLDWSVAKCLGFNPVFDDVTGDFFLPKSDYCFLKEYSPSTNWEQGGSIIEQNDISTFKLEYQYKVDARGFTTSKRIPVFGATLGECFELEFQRNSYGETYGEIYCIGTEFVTTGETLLIAAMRCYVASELGDKVKIPKDLL